MNKPYHHTQIGYVILVALGAALLLLTGLMLANGFDWVALMVLLFLAVCLVMFATLTVEIDDEALLVRFGPGPIQKRFRLADISSCRVVKNPWYYGWGIHLTPSGWLYNVSGFWAVELQMKTGQKYRLGTDDPQGLVQAVQDRL
ncbi:MAG: hypothetical protein BroJett011_19210 [Chloroflexota bacterium]|nr:MAG: hypothetical protein BroJett011_19210 [Chloroflexota bacterium]